MLPYAFSFSLFYILLSISTSLAAFLFYSYHRLGRNVLMRTMCMLVLIIFVTIVTGLAVNGVDYDGGDLLPEPNAMCVIQSIILNYCFIALQGLGCAIMIDNCIKGFQWKLTWLEPFGHESLFLSVSMLMPLIPTLLFCLRVSGLVTGLPIGNVMILPFYSVIAPPLILTSALWCMLFAIPGAIFALLFLFRIHRYSRQNRLKSGSTQVTTSTLIRLTVVIFIYIAMSVGTIVPMLQVQPATNLTSWPTGGGQVPSKAQRSPWSNPAMCTETTDDPYMYFYQRMRCPRPHSFVPALIGLGLFLMYGFSDTSSQVYRSMMRRISVLLGREKRRSSNIASNTTAGTPLEMEEATSIMDADIEVDEEEERMAALMIFGSLAKASTPKTSPSPATSSPTVSSSPTTSTRPLFATPISTRRHTMPAIILADPIPMRRPSHLRFDVTPGDSGSDGEDVSEGAHQRQDSTAR